MLTMHIWRWLVICLTYWLRHNVIEGLTQIESEIEHVKAILSQDDEGQALESYLERSREIRNKLPYLTGQIKNN